MTHADDAKLAEYARKLRWALTSLPEAERDGIVAEMRSHVLDRVDAGASVGEALAALGAPDDYARAFRENYAVAAALSSQRVPHLLSALLQGAGRSAAAAVVGGVIFMAWALALSIAYIAILKIGDPTHVGLWKGEHQFFIGTIDDPSTARDLLGLWIVPLALFLVVTAWIVTRFLAVWALRRLAPRP